MDKNLPQIEVEHREPTYILDLNQTQLRLIKSLVGIVSTNRESISREAHAIYNLLDPYVDDFPWTSTLALEIPEGEG